MSVFKNNGRLFNTLKNHRLLRGFAYAYIIYLAISVAVVLPLLNLSASPLYQQQTGRTLHHELIVFNPFTLSITAHHIRDSNPDDSVFWSARRLHVNPSLLQTIFRMAPTLDRFETADVVVHLQKINEEEWNFTDIVTHQNSRASAEQNLEENNSDAEIPAFIINQIDIDIDALQFTDSSRTEPFHTSINDINFQLLNFSTVKEAGQPYQFHARANDGGEFFWHGDVSVKSGTSAGQVGLKNIALKPAWEYFKPYLNFDLHSASFSFDGHYQVSWKDALDWSLTETNLYFHDIDIRNRHSRREKQEQKADYQTRIALPTLALEGISVFSQTEKVEVAAVNFNNFHLTSWSEADNSGLQQLLEVDLPASDDSTDEPSADEPSTDGKGQPNNWAAKIQQLTMTAAIDWRLGDLENHQFQITPLTIEVRDLYTAEDIPAAVTLAATIDQQTQVSVEGSFTAASLAGDISTAVQAVPLALTNPLLKPYLNAEIVSGNADIFADVSIRDALPTTVITRGQVDNFVLRPFSTPQELVKWQQLAWQDTQVDLLEQRLTIPLMQLQNFDSQFIITKEGKTNLHELFIEASSDEPSNTPENTSDNQTDESWAFALEKFQLKDASFRFHDESLVPNFTAAIQRFSGDLTNLSSDTKQLASFDFKGDVDGYAPVTLQGKTQPFLDDPKLNAALNFQNIDMGGLSSYSGTYAGWRIARGLLTANLDYSLADAHIVGDNHIVLDQLQFGERVRSNKALDLPLRLALALLTDKNGVATLDVGISGQVDDPGFDISKVIWSAVRNTLVKIATAPFSWLANLVKTDEDLGQVSFNSGSTQLLSKATQKLTLLKQALDQRPNLRLEARGQYDQKSDRRGLQAAAIKQRLQEYDVTGIDIKEKTTAWQKAVHAEYKKEYKKLDLPEPPQKLSADEEYELLLESVAITDTDLNTLAVERSVLVKQFLVQNLQVDNDRVLINSEIDCSKKDSCSSRIVSFDLSDLSESTQQRAAQQSPIPAE